MDSLVFTIRKWFFCSNSIKQSNNTKLNFWVLGSSLLIIVKDSNKQLNDGFCSIYEALPIRTNFCEFKNQFFQMSLIFGIDNLINSLFNKKPMDIVAKPSPKRDRLDRVPTSNILGQNGCSGTSSLYMHSLI